jgi:hypothetical protein
LLEVDIESYNEQIIKLKNRLNSEEAKPDEENFCQNMTGELHEFDIASAALLAERSKHEIVARREILSNDIEQR